MDSFYEIIDYSNPVNWDNPLNVGRVGWWLFTPQCNSNTLFDLTSKTKASLSGLTLGTKPRLGGFGSLFFDGTSGHVITFANATNFPLGSAPRTVSCWFAFGSKTAAQELFSYGGNTGTGQRFAIYFDGTGTNRFGLETENASSLFTFSYDTNWHQIVISSPGIATASVNLYLDGKKQTVSSLTNATINTQNSLPLFGDISGASGFTFNGHADDISLWNRALSDAEVYSLYNSSLLGYPNVLNRLSTIEYSFPQPPTVPTPNLLGIAGMLPTYNGYPFSL